MFETAEVGKKLGKNEYKERLPPLREALLDAQARLEDANSRVRRNAVSALGQLGELSKEYIPQVVACLEDAIPISVETLCGPWDSWVSCPKITSHRLLLA